MKKKKQTLLWKIHHPTQPNPSYVFGTMHVKDEKAFHLVAQVKTKIDEVDALANEFHFADMQQNTNPAAMQLPPEQTLDQLLRPKIYARLEQLMQQKIGMPATYFNQMLPLIVNNLLAEHILSTEMPVSLDQALYDYAVEQEKHTLGIESYAEQMETLQKIPLSYQVKSLEWTIKNYGAYEKEILKMRRYYEESAIDKLYHSTRRSLKGMRKLLLYNRNEVMAKRIAQFSETQSLVCAIGAAHLWGKKGVLRLLKLEGLRVKPLKV